MSYYLLISSRSTPTNVHIISESICHLEIILTDGIFLLGVGISQSACAKMRPYSGYST